MNRRIKSTRPARPRIGKGRYAAIAVALLALAAWSVAGGRIIAAINPTLRHELALAMRPPLDVWITLPDDSGAQPIIISTPAGALFEHETIKIPQGSVVSAHLSDPEGDAPDLVTGNASHIFTADAHGDFAATEKLTTGDSGRLAIERGSRVLAAWKIDVVADAPPKITMTEPLSITAGKALRVAYSASDDFGVDKIAVRVTPRNPPPGANRQPVDILLPAPAARQMTRVDFADLADRPWAGQQVSIQLVATNRAGAQGISNAVDVTLPERGFFHPVARILIEERRKLLLHPDDQALREEAANIMAGIAHQTGDYHGDPVVLMTLRSGAVRLILDQGHDSALSVNDMLWQAAIRIEDGKDGQAQKTLRDARQDLAQAARRGAGQDEIQSLAERLRQAILAYTQALSASHAAHADGHLQADLSHIP